MSEKTAQGLVSDSELDDRVGRIEQRGIGLIPLEERHGRPVDLFWTWLAANAAVGYVVVGALVVYLGLSFATAVVAIVIGNLAFLCVGVTSLQGPEVGTTTFTISRASFGQNGNRGLSFFNWMTLVGFEATSLALIVLAGRLLLKEAGVDATGTGLTLLILLAALLVQVLVPLLGHATILVVQRYLAYLFIPMYIIMAILIVPKTHVGSIHGGGSIATISVAFAIIVSGGGLSWANAASDYSRYLAPSTSKAGIFWWSSLGGMVAALTLELLGAAVASVTKNVTDPISGLPHVLPTGFLVPFLILAILTLWSGNTLDLYSSGVTLQALGIPLKRTYCVLIDLVVAGTLAAITVFSSKFNSYFTDFLGLIILWLAPWFAIFVVDWLLRKTYDAEALVNASGGRYYRRNGIHVPGIIALLIGGTASGLWLNTTLFQGPLSSRTGHSDMSVFMGIVVAGVIYWALESIPVLHRLTHPRAVQPTEQQAATS